jgi:hypothetical protein
LLKQKNKPKQTQNKPSKSFRCDGSLQNKPETKPAGSSDIILSGAKHLLFLKETIKSGVLRFAQDDRAGGIFPQPAGVL